MNQEPKTFYGSRLIGKISSRTLDELKENLTSATQRQADLSEQLVASQERLKGLKQKKGWVGLLYLNFIEKRLSNGKMKLPSLKKVFQKQKKI